MKTRALLFALLLLSLGSGTALAQKWAADMLDKSPRHHEWVELKHGDRTVKAFLAFPEVKEKAPAVIVIHEIFGLTDWAKNMADEIAAAGYIAIAPDLLTEPGKDTQSYPDKEAAIKAISALPQAQVFADLDAAAEYAAKLPACNGVIAVTGFCWGGTQSFAYANHIDLSAISQTTAYGVQTTIAQFIYNTQHRPILYTDAAGQTTSYDYNAAGQLISADP